MLSAELNGPPSASLVMRRALLPLQAQGLTAVL
jgi:hypothetical protein